MTQDISWGFRELYQVNFLSIPTWLAIGAILQLLGRACLPATMSAFLPILYLSFRIIRVSMGPGHGFNSVRPGKWVGRLPRREDPAENEGLVVFVLGARMNHPLGPLAHGNDTMKKALETMWQEANTNQEKWGFLGKSGALYDTSDVEGITVAWLTYWRDLKGLQGFANSAVHMAGKINYDKKMYPNMGIMHEIFHAPNGHWETSYENFPPWGIGKIAEHLQTHFPKTSKIEESSIFRRMRLDGDRVE